MLRIIAQGKGDRRDKQAKTVERDKRACSPNPRASAESRQHNIYLSPTPLKILCQGMVLFKLPPHTIQMEPANPVRKLEGRLAIVGPRIPTTRSVAAAVQLGPTPSTRERSSHGAG
jgi:hypothetical protein